MTDGKMVMAEAVRIKEQIVADRRYLHSHPGTEFDIDETKEYVMRALAEMGYVPVECGKAGIVAVIEGTKPETGEQGTKPAGIESGNGGSEGKTFLLRADMDGLPIREETDLPFASVNGNMHACGHDMHTAMLLGAARLLKKFQDSFSGTVKLMFQPAEEVFQGSHDMIENGLLENPHVDGALMIHVMAGMPFAAGTALVSAPGVSAPAADYFDIEIQGKGSHGSMPNAGVDPISIGAHVLLALQEINARELAMSQKAVLTIGSIHGGNASNVIPDKVTMGGTLRTYDEETRAFVKERILSVAENTARAFRGQAKVSYGSGCPTLLNDGKLEKEALAYISEALGPDKTVSVAELLAKAGGGEVAGSAGSEDFAYISQCVPSIMVALAAGEPNKGYKYPQHHPMVKFDEEALPAGSAVYAYTAIRWLNEH